MQRQKQKTKSSHHLRLWSHLGHKTPTRCLGSGRVSPTAPIFSQSDKHLHPGNGAMCFRPPSLPYPLGVPCERLPCRIGCRLAKGVAYPPPTSLTDVFFNWLLLCFLHNTSLEILSGQRILRIFLRQVLIKTCIFFMVVTMALQVSAPWRRRRWY
ncbi:hypothetical protein DPMN_058994 [Dreissena polymorpha]|uniref:Uncharacterized protein n=1 Tax=Dreissena polymorpha TaxID=45954 RepID=A0A9D4C315_DREPO|nr:hypothetical protein DPMN_058994 [Dreissena polymorpha]